MSSAHWDQIYEAKGDQVTWFQPTLTRSLRLIDSRGLAAGASAIDVGAGNASLAASLLERDFGDVTLVDLSQVALDAVRSELGEHAERVSFVVGDITTVDLPAAGFDLWHDRAAFHFLTTKQERSAYARQLRRAIRPGGTIVIVTFGPDGPLRCSGLPALRYDAAMLHEELGSDALTLVTHEFEIHHTPSGGEQQFLYAVFERRP